MTKRRDLITHLLNKGADWDESSKLPKNQRNASNLMSAKELKKTKNEDKKHQKMRKDSGLDIVEAKKTKVIRDKINKKYSNIYGTKTK